ncbi:unnamed protein product, partial [Iphiclides podalirius]
MKIYLLIPVFAIIIADVTAKKKYARDESDDYESTEQDSSKAFDLRGTLRQHFGLIASLRDPDENGVCSPISALLPLGKLALGAQGAGLKELNKAIGVSSDDELDEDYSDEHSESVLEKHLSDLIESLRDLEGVTLDVASRLYISNDKRLFKNYTKAAKRIFKTSIEKADFNEPITVAKSVNDWVALKTHGMIPEIISPQDVSPRSSLLIVNAIYFAGKWEHPFGEVAPGTFYSPKRDKKVFMMTNTAWYYYKDSKTLSAQLIRIPYVGAKSSFLIVLPNEKSGLQSLLKRLKRNPKLLAQAVDGMKSTNIQLTMPKFRIESQWDLGDLYRNIGLSSVFDRRKSGLTGIVRDEKLAVSAAIQKAVIEVNELGTKAAASSAVVYLSAVIPQQFVANLKIFETFQWS